MNKKQRPVYRRNSDARDFLVRKDNGGYYLVLQKEILHFNQLGQLTATQDFNGCKVRYHYENDLLISISDGFGRSVVLEYEGGIACICIFL